MIELLFLTGSSILADLTASSFKKTYYQFPVPLSITSGSSSISFENGLTAICTISSKSQNVQNFQIFSLCRGASVPQITELKSSSMFGRLLWASNTKSAASQPRVFTNVSLKNTNSFLLLSLCQDEMFRVWNQVSRHYDS